MQLGITFLSLGSTSALYSVGEVENQPPISTSRLDNTSTSEAVNLLPSLVQGIMSTSPPELRKLANTYKCGQCRKDRQKVLSVM
jgi:hypothetical protein